VTRRPNSSKGGSSPAEGGSKPALGELFRALGSLVEPPTPAGQRVADLLDLGPLPGEAECTELFLFQLTPYASVYLGPEGMLGGEALDRIAGFWRALRQEPPVEPDHLAVMLGFYARLMEEEADSGETRARGALRRARKAFLWEHFLSWLPPYLDKIGDLGPPFYRRWARLLEDALREEVGALGAQERLALHLREAPDIADPRTEAPDGFVGALLSPVRSGMILARSDLGRAGRELDLGTRAGERRFVLRGLLEQNPSGTLEWLRREAVGWAERHGRPDPLAPGIADFWRRRSQATADLLRDLAEGTGLEQGGGAPGRAEASARRPAGPETE
jgi:TorA maturation chaperone TorD